MKPKTRKNVEDKRSEAAQRQDEYKKAKNRRKKATASKAKRESDKHRALRLEKKKLAERARRARIKEDPEAYEAAKLEERKRWNSRREQGKVKLIADLSRREQNVKRKKGREAFKRWNEKKKNKRDDESSTNPGVKADVETVTTESTLSKQAKVAKEKEKKRRDRCYQNNRVLLQENQSLIAKQEQMQRKIHALERKDRRRRAVEKRRLEGSPEQRVASLLKGAKVKPAIKESLLFGEILKSQLKAQYRESKTEREKHVLGRVLSGKVIKKYRKLEKVIKNIAPVKSSTLSNYTSLLQKVRRPSTAVRKETASIVEQFFIDNSRECPGKKDCLTRSGEKRQKRYLNATIGELYRKYNNECGKSSRYEKLSYVTFTRLRPFNIVAPKVTNRDTCLCITCENMTLLVKALHSRGVIQETTTDSIINSIVCADRTEHCLSRDCRNCVNKTVSFSNRCNQADIIEYEKWMQKKEERISAKTNQPITVSITCKEKKRSTYEELKSDFENSLAVFIQHRHRVEHQYRATTSSRKNLTIKDLLLHIDFSENYICKYGSEPHSAHFGASKPQITLHTGMAYTKDFKEGFGTFSASLQHDPPAITAHLVEVLEHYLDKFPTVDHLHFLSDSPSTQYRNRKMFYLITEHLPKRFTQIKRITYNYSEAGHGKGAPDGVGADLKRTADAAVAVGNDVNSLEKLLQVFIDRNGKVRVSSVTEESIKSIEAVLPSEIDGFPGTMKVHQYKWSKETGIIYFNSLSCNDCSTDQPCSHYHLGKLKYNSHKRRSTKAKKAVAPLKKQNKKVTSAPSRKSTRKMLGKIF